MIGRALNHEQMTKVIRNLTGLEQPWNCPHGRPTMRFMADLPPLRADDAAAEEQLRQADAEPSVQVQNEVMLQMCAVSLLRR